MTPRRERLAIALSLAASLPVAFYWTDLHMAVQPAGGIWRPASAWDALVPFCPGWIWPYLLYFPMCFLPLFFVEVRRDLESFRRTAAGYALVFGLAIAGFWARPSGIVRPAPGEHGLSALVLGWFYRLDPGFNVFPSLHVANTAFVACLAWRLKGPRWGGACWLLVGAISASAVLVKQHYLADIPSGLLLGVLGYRAAFSSAAGAWLSTRARR